jgi:hypothetical protein
MCLYVVSYNNILCMIRFTTLLSRYMSYTLLKVASENRSVVAVVGREHLQGIKKNWKQPIKVRRLVNILLFIYVI